MSMEGIESKIIGNVVEIQVSAIKVPDGRYRKEMGDIASLAESINTMGQLVPILIKEDLTLIAGERRLRAHEYLKKATIKAIVETRNDIENRILEILENLERKEFTWQEGILATDDLHNLFKAQFGDSWSERKTAEKAGISTGGIATDLNLAEAFKVDPEMFDKCKNKAQALKVLQKYKKDEVMAEIALRRSRTDYGRNAKNHVFLGDCTKLIDTLPGQCIDAVISDPFYGIDINKVKKSHDRNLNDIYEDDPELYFKTMSTLIDKLPRVMKKDSWILIFCRVENFYWLHEKLTSKGYSCDPIPGIWNRGTGQTNRPEWLMARSYEVFVYGHIGDAIIVRPGMSNVLSYTGVHPVEKTHEVQKPLELMRELISRLCLPGYTILDFMCGSATTLVAALQQGCNPIGFELDEKNYNNAVVRVAEALKMKDSGRLDLAR